MNNPLTLDDKEFRKKQSERFSEGIGNLGDYAKELKKTTKINTYIGIISGGFILIFLIVTLIFAYGKGGIGGVFDLSSTDRYFNCSNGIMQDQVRTYGDAFNFVRVFNGSCIVYHLKK